MRGPSCPTSAQATLPAPGQSVQGAGSNPQGQNPRLKTAPPRPAPPRPAAFSKCGFCHPDLISVVETAAEKLLAEPVAEGGKVRPPA